MPAYNFQKQFAPDVESGRKRQTIRKERKHPGANAQPGKPLQLYTGMRSKACRKLLNPDPVCKRVDRISLDTASYGTTQWRRVTVNGEGVVQAQAEEIAKADGFKDIDAMFDWFQKTHGLPFHGLLIRW